MSIDIYYTIRKNQKTNYVLDSLFFGKRKVFDYPIYVDNVFDTYDEACVYIIFNHLSYKDVHVRKCVVTSCGVIITDYCKRR